MKPPAAPAPPPITPKQLREARRLLGWSRNRLAVQSGTTVGFIGGFEDMGIIRGLLWHPDGFNALDAMRTALDAAGVEFVDESDGRTGMRLRKAEP